MHTPVRSSAVPTDPFLIVFKRFLRHEGEISSVTWPGVQKVPSVPLHSSKDAAMTVLVVVSSFASHRERETR